MKNPGRPRAWKPIFLWTHLCIGLLAGTVIFYLSLTGLLLAFKPQIVELSRAGLNTPASVSLPLAELIEKVKSSENADLKSLTLWKEKSGYLEMQFGREKNLYSFVDGSRLQLGSFWNSFFESTTNLHRWFSTKNEGDHKIQKALKGVCMILFLLLVVTGIVLWYPTAIFKLNLKLKKKAFNWNLHTVLGFWLSPIIILISLTGLIMAHQWANNLLFWATGSEASRPPKKMEVRETVNVNSANVNSAQLSQMIKMAQEKAPQWQSVTARIEKGLVKISIEEIIGANLSGRSQLQFEAETGQELFWEPYSGLSLGRKIRSAMHPVHTGEAGGFFGQFLVSLGALTSMILVWTGFAMSYRRFFKETTLKTNRIEGLNS